MTLVTWNGALSRSGSYRETETTLDERKKEKELVFEVLGATWGKVTERLVSNGRETINTLSTRPIHQLCPFLGDTNFKFSLTWLFDILRNTLYLCKLVVITLHKKVEKSWFVSSNVCIYKKE